MKRLLIANRGEIADYISGHQNPTFIGSGIRKTYTIAFFFNFIEEIK